MGAAASVRPQQGIAMLTGKTATRSRKLLSLGTWHLLFLVYCCVWHNLQHKTATRAAAAYFVAGLQACMTHHGAARYVPEVNACQNQCLPVELWSESAPSNTSSEKADPKLLTSPAVRHMHDPELACKCCNMSWQWQQVCQWCVIMVTWQSGEG